MKKKTNFRKKKGFQKVSFKKQKLSVLPAKKYWSADFPPVWYKLGGGERGAKNFYSMTKKHKLCFNFKNRKVIVIKCHDLFLFFPGNTKDIK
jgi:hypothetical protein